MGALGHRSGMRGKGECALRFDGFTRSSFLYPQSAKRAFDPRVQSGAGRESGRRSFFAGSPDQVEGMWEG